MGLAEILKKHHNIKSLVFTFCAGGTAGTLQMESENGDTCIPTLLTGKCMNVVANLQVDAVMTVTIRTSSIKALYYKGVASIIIQCRTRNFLYIYLTNVDITKSLLLSATGSIYVDPAATINLLSAGSSIGLSNSKVASSPVDLILSNVSIIQ